MDNEIIVIVLVCSVRDAVLLGQKVLPLVALCRVPGKFLISIDY